ncbi:MAG: pilus assembly protein [Pirellulaceae bacterium]|nr:pilus assembly protein [Pirellulaceae bacterium]
MNIYRQKSRVYKQNSHKESLVGQQPRGKGRNGVVAVEFALVAPVLLLTVLGMVQVSKMLDTKHLLTMAVREGGRMGAMDRTGLVAEGSTSNDKLRDDVLHFLQASGISTEGVTVQIGAKDDIDVDFNLDAPENHLQLFQVEVRLPYDLGLGSVAGPDDFHLSARVVFRNGKATLIQ